MPKVSVIILTKNRFPLLQKALASIGKQTFHDFEVVAVNDGSTDDSARLLEDFSKILNLQIINHKSSQGITLSRQEALERSGGEYVAILDDDDTWIDEDKLKKQSEFLTQHPEYVLVGGGMNAIKPSTSMIMLRPEKDGAIRKTMLVKNNFFTSTVMFRKDAALKAGGFIKDKDDFAEDYDLWLRLGKIGKMHNFQEAFTEYRLPAYNKARKKAFLAKQLALMYREKANYPGFLLASLILKVRLLL